MQKYKKQEHESQYNSSHSNTHFNIGIWNEEFDEIRKQKFQNMMIMQKHAETN